MSTKGWRTTSLGDKDIALTASGGTPDRSDPSNFGGDIPWVKSGELNDSIIYGTEEKLTRLGLQNSSAKLFPRGTLLLAMYGATAGKTGILGIEATTNQAVCAIFPQGNSFDSRFLQFHLIYNRRKLMNARSGGAQPNISQRVIATLDVHLPPMEEQRAIASALDMVQNAKEARHRELALERERKAALMEYLFSNGTRGEPTNETEAGRVPCSWKLTTLEGVCQEQPQNGAFIKGALFGAGIPYVNVYDIYQDTVLAVERVQRLKSDDPTLRRYLLKKNDVLFVRSSLKREGVGQCCLVGPLSEPAIFDCHLIRISPDTSSVDPLYLTYFFLSESRRNDLIARSKTTTMTTLNQNMLMQSPVMLPALTEQVEISKTLAASDSKIAAIEREISVLDELFKALLEELMTGRLPASPLIEEHQAQ